MTTNNEVARLFASFENCKFNHMGAEAWRARDLQPLLGYTEWRNFREAITRAWESIRESGNNTSTNFLTGTENMAWTPGEVFVGANKNPKGGRPREDVIFSRRAAYLVAMNGDPRKAEVAFAQHYFAVATRTLEVIQQRLVESARLQTREKLTETESRFQGVLYHHDVDGDGIGRIRSKGDEVLFGGGNNTQQMKDKWSVPKGRPLADFAPEVANIAKQLGAAITTHNVKTNDLRGEDQITAEHIENNKMVRGGLDSRGIVLENLDGEEDIKKIERRHASDAKKLTAPDKVKAPKTAKPKAKADPATKKAPAQKATTSSRKKPTAATMVAWFRDNHERAVNSSPYESAEGGYQYPLADVIDVLVDQFPNATPAVLSAAETELDKDGPWVTMEFTNARAADRMSDRG